jgi:hypothetical protein
MRDESGHLSLLYRLKFESISEPVVNVFQSNTTLIEKFNGRINSRILFNIFERKFTQQIKYDINDAVSSFIYR